MKKTMSVMLVLITVLSLISCGEDEEPPAPSDDTATQSRFADFDATRDFTLAASGRGKKNFIYGDYCYSANKSIHRVPLPKGDESETRVEREVVCVDPMCKHADFAPDDPKFTQIIAQLEEYAAER